MRLPARANIFMRVQRATSFGHLEVAVGAADRVHDPLRDPLAVEARSFSTMLVLEQHRAGGPAVWEFWLSATGAPDSVVVFGRSGVLIGPS